MLLASSNMVTISAISLQSLPEELYYAHMLDS